jgi:hypothetical protein
MESNRKLRSVVATVALGMVVVWFSTSWGQGRSNYQTETRVYTTPEYRTDTTRAIEAYEKLMEKYTDMTERNFSGISADLKTVTAKLNTMDTKLAALDARLARIEKRLGITTEAPAARDPNAPAVLPQKPQAQEIIDVPVTLN